MPDKYNEPRRHKIPRARYRIQNWPEYERALQRRGDLTVWVTPEAIAAWCPPREGRRGRPRDGSDVAIETGHLLFYFLAAPQGGVPVFQTSDSGPTGWVSAVDMMSLMALSLFVFAELVVLILSLWLLFRTMQVSAEFPQSATA